MQASRLIAIVIAIAALGLGVVSACGGSNDASGTIGGEVTIGTGTEGTPVDSGSTAAEGGATTAAAGGETTAATGGETTAATDGETTASAGGEGDAAAGAAVYQSAGCGGCHTLAAAGSAGAVGPNLDDLKPDYQAVLTKVTNGGGGMPAFGDQLSADDIKNVSAYVSQNAGK